jgi:hypothetical protein
MVMLGTDKTEPIRFKSPQHRAISPNIGCSCMLFADVTNASTSVQKVEIEIKPHKIGGFRKVKLDIPSNRDGCNLLLIRDPDLSPPYYFRSTWISQELFGEYTFPGHNNSFDTVIFSKEYSTIIEKPSVSFLYKNEPFTAERMRQVNPFNGQNIELMISITPAENTPYTARIKAIEIAFVHPTLTNIESKYIISATYGNWPQHDSRFYWPDDFTTIPGAKIILKSLYWYKDRCEIKEKGMVVQTIEF